MTAPGVAGPEAGAANGNGPGHSEAEPVHPGRHDDSGAGTWVLQADAAARTGFSVSALRKWRRMGVVADRKITGNGGVERVEVKLEDVLARAALLPDRQRSEPLQADGPPQEGAVVMRIEDLEEIFERMVVAERRAERAQEELESMRAENRFLFGQMSELRRQIRAGTDGSPPGQASTPPAAPAPAPAAPPPARTAVTPVRVSRGNGVAGWRDGPEERPAQNAPPPANRAGPDQDAEVRELTEELRRIYGRLDGYRRQPEISPEVEGHRQRDLGEYDRVLLAVYAALGAPTGLAAGERLTVATRGALTRALARAGLDVRAASTAEPAGHPRATARQRRS